MQSLDIDILCLQEVRSDTLQYLQQNFYASTAIPRHYYGREVYSVIAAGIKSRANVAKNFNRPIRNTLLSQFSGWRDADSQFQYSDYLFEKNRLRVFNVHLPYQLAPSLRMLLLDEVMQNLCVDANIVCGDFNSFAHWPYNPFLGILNRSSWNDFFSNEMKMLKNHCQVRGLKLSMEQVVTCPFWGTQIDHILIPNSWTKFFSRTYGQRFGSDHKPVVLETTEI